MHMRAPHSKSPAHDSLRRLCKLVTASSNAKIHRLLLTRVSQRFKTPKQQYIKFILKSPEQGVVCPITQESIASPMPEEALPFDLDHPDRTCIRLACCHDFSAFWLLFNWIHNNHVKCPLCRAGPSELCLDVARMPHHIRVPLQRHMRKLELRLESNNNALAEAAAARDLVDAVAGKSFLDLFPEQPLQECIDRLECTKQFVPFHEDELLLLSQPKSHQVFALIAKWVNCNIEKNTPTWININFNNEPCILPIGIVFNILDHVLNVTYGLSFSYTFDRSINSFVCSAFQRSPRELKNDPF